MPRNRLNIDVQVVAARNSSTLACDTHQQKSLRQSYASFRPTDGWPWFVQPFVPPHAILRSPSSSLLSARNSDAIVFRASAQPCVPVETGFLPKPQNALPVSAH